MSPLATPDDLLDLRAYERERARIRAEVIALKKLRRVALGPIASVVFENEATVRFQIQEMLRAERIIDDRLVQEELDVYAPLLPARGELSMTLFLELTSPAELREWLPRLVGIERSLRLRIGGEGGGPGGAGPGGGEPGGGEPCHGEGGGFVEVAGVVDPAHASQLTREETTASVHYVKIALPEELIGPFLAGPAALASVHPEYRHEVELRDETRRSLAGDW